MILRSETIDRRLIVQPKILAKRRAIISHIHYLPNELSNCAADLFIRPAWKNTFPLHGLWKLVLRVCPRNEDGQCGNSVPTALRYLLGSSRFRRGGGVCFLVWTAGVAASERTGVASRRRSRDARHPRSFPRLCVPPFPCHLRFWERDRRSDHAVQAQEVLDFSGGE